MVTLGVMKLALILASSMLALPPARPAHAEDADLARLRAAVLATPAPHPAAAAAQSHAAGQALPAGLAQTSIERRFSHDQAAGALGFLCGRDADHGGPTAFGEDPHGRFLGARLSLAIR